MATMSMSSHHHINVFFEAKNGFATTLLKFLDVKTIQELLATSRMICTFLADYYQHNEIHDEATFISNILNYFRFFPHASACNMMVNSYGYSGKMISNNMFVGKGRVRMLCLSGCILPEDFNPRIFEYVETLVLNFCSGITNNTFTHMGNVRSLEIIGATSTVTNEALLYLQSIEHLNLDGFMADIDDDGLALLDGVVSLNLSRWETISDTSISILTRTGCLQELNLSWCDGDWTSQSIPLLKQIPVLDMTGCKSSVCMELCDICNRMYRIDRCNRASHLKFDCDIICELCSKPYKIGDDYEHYTYNCTQNFIECTDCHDMILRKHKHRHIGRCTMRLITCTSCSDSVPYYKKDFLKHIHSKENYDNHIRSLQEQHGILSLESSSLLREIGTMMENTGLRELCIPSKHRVYMDYMEMTVAKHEGNMLKRLTVVCNMLEQLVIMRAKHKQQLKERIADLDSRDYDFYDDAWQAHEDYLMEQRMERWD